MQLLEAVPVLAQVANLPERLCALPSTGAASSSCAESTTVGDDQYCRPSGNFTTCETWKAMQ